MPRSSKVGAEIVEGGRRDRRRSAANPVLSLAVKLSTEIGCQAQPGIGGQVQPGISGQAQYGIVIKDQRSEIRH
ncbi:MAG: hypothetical protein HGJ97_08330 [Desulfosporosinus sp.]|nr:hypothetical protein [Desulfosporosinus sp.]